MTRYSKSNEMLARAEKVIPLGAQTFSKSRIQFPTPYAPLYLERGQDGHVWDVDGNEYVDLICGLLPITLGYCDLDVDNAIKNQLQNGISFSLGTELEIELSEKLVEIIPSAEKVRFGKNGSDATSAAIRLARAFTGRDHVVACGYHGWQDWYIGGTVRRLGIPDDVCALTHKIPFNDLNGIKEACAKHKGKIAAIILEPASSTEPNEGYLEALRSLCDEEGIILIFDEVITGFRLHIGGAQALYKVTPDLSAFGKGMANGMPISAIVGRADVMDLMEDIFYSGTFGGETLSLAASIATIDKMKNENVIEKLWNTGQQISSSCETMINKYDLQNIIKFTGVDPWKVIGFSDHEHASKEAIKTRFMIEMLKYGVLLGGSHNICFSHTQADINLISKAYEEALSTIKKELDQGTLQKELEVDPIHPVFRVRE